MEYISGPVHEGHCPVMGEGGNIFNFCEVGLKISGRYPIVGRVVYSLGSEAVTSLASTTPANTPTLVLGTSGGDLVVVAVSQNGYKNVARYALRSEAAVVQLVVLNGGGDLIYLQEKEASRDQELA